MTIFLSSCSVTNNRVVTSGRLVSQSRTKTESRTFLKRKLEKIATKVVLCRAFFVPTTVGLTANIEVLFTRLLHCSLYFVHLSLHPQSTMKITASVLLASAASTAAFTGSANGSARSNAVALQESQVRQEVTFMMLRSRRENHEQVVNCIFVRLSATIDRSLDSIWRFHRILRLRM